MSSSDIPTYEKSFTESQAIDFIRKILTKLKELQESSDFNLIYRIFKNLGESYFDLASHRKAMSVELLRLKYVAITSNFIGKVNAKGYFTNDDVWYSTYYAFNCLWNNSDEFQEIAYEIVLTDLPQYLVSNVLHKPFLDGLQSPNIYYLIKASISIIHNVVRWPGFEAKFKIDELKKVLVTLIQRNDSDFIGLVSILTLSCLVNENELCLLEQGKNSIKVLIETIKTAFQSESKRVNGFSIWELVNGLKCISANDNMKKTILSENGIPLIFDILKSPTCDEDSEKCLGVLWNLCFDKEIKTLLINEYDLKNVIKQFENHQSSKITKIYDGIFWLIDDKAQLKQRIKSAHYSKIKSSKPKWKFDVFISYSWTNKPIILSIREYLMKSNIRIWIDIDQMQGSTLEAMADGIENSNVFIMAVSEAYRTSPNCRTEAEYAFALKKPTIPLVVELKYKPTSWLGIIIGSKTYYEFSERRNFDESIQGLLVNINSLVNNKQSNILTDTIVVQNDVTDSTITSSRAVIRNSLVYSWTSKKVTQWLIKNGLGHVKTKFAIIDGKLLSSMINLNSKSPKYLFTTLKSEFGMQFSDILKLSSALESVNV